MITNRNRIEGMSRDGEQALDSEAIKLSVTANVNSVSSSESKKELTMGDLWRREPPQKSAATIVAGTRASSIKERTHEQRRVKSLREVFACNICKSYE